jgi:selenocysteine lyase/cysteine desulfurase
MRPERAGLFPINRDLVMFNHASYGLATTALLAQAEHIRRDLESDPNVNLGEPLQERLEEVLVALSAELGIDPGLSALTTSATSGAAALQRSVPLAAGDVVIALDCEYSSVLRGWERRCAEVGADLRIVSVKLPFQGVDELLREMTVSAGDRVAILQFSAISSSAALQLPVSRLAAWGHERGATVVVDAAHAPGHVDIGSWEGVDAAFGTIHKWFPVPRSVGILWVAPKLADLIHPAEVSLTWDSAGLGRRFAWPGTFDPSVRLCVPDAVAVQRTWAGQGWLGECERLSDYATDELSRLGAASASSFPSAWGARRCAT